MQNFIEITMHNGKKKLINTNFVVNVVDNEITLSTEKNFPIKCRESYEELKKKISNADKREVDEVTLAEIQKGDPCLYWW